MPVVGYDGIEKYNGCVIRTFERNGYHDSDFYAECINIETGEIDVVEYDTTRCGGGGYASEDLSEDNFRQFQRISYLRQLADAIVHDSKKSSEISVGKKVVIIKGRKVPIGTEGTVFWCKEVNYDKYNRWYKSVLRIGIKDSEGNVYWTNANNAEVINPNNYKTSPKQLAKLCKKRRSQEYLHMKRIFSW